MNIHPSEQITIAHEGRIYIYLLIFFYLFMNIHPSEQIAVAQEGGIYIYLFIIYLFIFGYTSFRTK